MSSQEDGLTRASSKGQMEEASPGNRIVENLNLNELKVGQSLFVFSKNTKYTIEKRSDGFYISGHPKKCPTPTQADIFFSYPDYENGNPYFLKGMQLRYKILVHKEDSPYYSTNESTLIQKIEAPEKM